MRRVVIAVVSFLVAWLAVSLILGLMYTVINPVAELAVMISGRGAAGLSTYTLLNGLLILVLTFGLARPIYRQWMARFGNRGGSAVQPTARSAAGVSAPEYAPGASDSPTVGR